MTAPVLYVYNIALHGSLVAWLGTLQAAATASKTDMRDEGGIVHRICCRALMRLHTHNACIPLLNVDVAFIDVETVSRKVLRHSQITDFNSDGIRRGRGLQEL